MNFLNNIVRENYFYVLLCLMNYYTRFHFSIFKNIQVEMVNPEQNFCLNVHNLWQDRPQFLIDELSTERIDVKRIKYPILRLT